MYAREIEELLAKMTLEEKVSLCHANSKFATGSVERLGIGELTMSDGPHGVRPEVERDSWKCLNRPTAMNTTTYRHHQRGFSVSQASCPYYRPILSYKT